MCRPSPASAPEGDGTATPGLTLIRAEMARQHADALESFHAMRAEAGCTAGRIAAAGRLVMLGMGASHWANRMALGTYRALGLDAVAEPLSDHMRLPLQAGGQVTLLVSQSGESGEIAEWFRRNPGRDGQFGLTMNAGSTLARAVPCLVGSGEREKAYAATRSIMVTLALHAALIDALGGDVRSFLDELEAGPARPALPEAATAPLLDCSTLFLSSRGTAHAALEAAALTWMELARIPALALELGQLLHGPTECLSPTTGLILVRPAGPDAAAITASRARRSVTVSGPSCSISVRTKKSPALP